MTTTETVIQACVRVEAELVEERAHVESHAAEIARLRAALADAERRYGNALADLDAERAEVTALRERVGLVEARTAVPAQRPDEAAPVAIGDTYEHASAPGVAWEVTESYALAANLWRLEAGASLWFASTEQLTDPAGPWRRCEARAVTQ